MGSRNRFREMGIAAAVVAVSAALVYFGMSLNPIWWLMWLAPIPVLWFAARSAALPSVVVAAMAWLFGALSWWSYLREYVEVPFVSSALALTVPALLFAGAVLLWRRLLLRGHRWTAALSLPAAITAIGYFGQILSPNSTAGNVAYSQMDFLPLIQIASITGIWGISFLLLLVPSTTGVLVRDRMRALPLAGSVFAALALVLVFGAWRLRAPGETTGIIHVQLMTNDKRGEVYAERDPRSAELLQTYLSELGTGTPEVIIIPEKIARFTEQGATAARTALSAAAKARHAYLLAGLDEMRGSHRRNDALLFAPDGSVPIDYEKHHFVPGIELGYQVGDEYSVTEKPSGVWGVTICKDMDFPELGREYAKRGTGVLLVPAWDFRIDGWYHARMAILRGVESGYSVARAAKQGLLTVSDNRGRILVEKAGSPAGMVTADAYVPVSPGATLYARWGDWFPWLSIPIFLLSLYLAFRPLRGSGH
jgi:apolipoprotein N-acyltransferase